MRRAKRICLLRICGALGPGSLGAPALTFSDSWREGTEVTTVEKTTAPWPLLPMVPAQPASLSTGRGRPQQRASFFGWAGGAEEWGISCFPCAISRHSAH